MTTYYASKKLTRKMVTDLPTQISGLTVEFYEVAWRSSRGELPAEPENADIVRIVWRRPIAGAIGNRVFALEVVVLGELPMFRSVIGKDGTTLPNFELVELLEEQWNCVILPEGDPLVDRFRERVSAGEMT